MGELDPGEWVEQDHVEGEHRAKVQGQERCVEVDPKRVPVTQPRVWVRGHVPKEFLDWVERHWAHDNETKAMLSKCCFEVWER